MSLCLAPQRAAVGGQPWLVDVAPSASTSIASSVGIHLSVPSPDALVGIGAPYLHLPTASK